jgi:Zn-dependent peptidase ImmA (M78 family)/DNA-binding XRE family transcriptional regulator
MLPTKNQESKEMAKVAVNGKVLQWARDIRGLTLDDAANRLGVSSSELLGYESGSIKPAVGLLRRMSRKYRINFSSLLMPEPLPPTKQPPDHRRRFGRKRISVDTLVAIEEITEALEAFDDISSDIRSIVPRPKIGTAKLADNPVEVAARERAKFGVTIEQQRKWRGLADARVKWRERVEERGVFTYMMSLPPKELSGFSILYNDLAAICINDNEPTEGAKIFTLFHEYCHLLLRNTGISDNNDGNRVERFCNRFAASFLIPKSDLVDAISQSFRGIQTPCDFSDADVRQLASWFRVSNRAIALRLEKTGLAPHGFYAKRTGAWDIPVPKPVILDSKRQPNAIKIRIKRIGRLHASTVIEAMKRNAINPFDASELFGLQLRPTTLKSIQAALE